MGTGQPVLAAAHMQQAMQTRAPDRPPRTGGSAGSLTGGESQLFLGPYQALIATLSSKHLVGRIETQNQRIIPF
jgi:hypothetical protein